jgi:AraC family transcriptional regulator of adaptative response / DNA-3-methyladenine glycosylase II
MRLTFQRMYDRLLASDASCNGQFFTGVLTTGIYCLPSCGARKPKPANVRFFPTCEAARAAGLRACRKCHPDDFARGADPVLADIEMLVAEMREAPARFPDVRAVVKRSGFGTTRLFELFRLHYQRSPADVLLRARIEAARQRLLGSDDALIEIASAVGFESLSVLHQQFRRLTGLTPSEYRALRDGGRFSVALPADYPIPYLRRALSRDRVSRSERLIGNEYHAAVQLSTGAAVIALKLSPDHVEADPGSAGAVEVHRIVVGLLGLDQDAAAFARLARKAGLSRLIAGRPGLRVTQTATVFDGLVWSIVGQQINFEFACTLKRRLTELAGAPVADGLIAPPTPQAIAQLSPADLAPLQFSARKAEYLIETARQVVAGTLDLDQLRTASATRVERTLLGVRGFGPWSVNYVMMRALALPDCVPLGDTGVTSSLQTLLQLEQRPDVDATRRLMSVFSPYRSLATAHLWQLNQPAP